MTILSKTPNEVVLEHDAPVIGLVSGTVTYFGPLPLAGKASRSKSHFTLPAEPSHVRKKHVPVETSELKDPLSTNATYDRATIRSWHPTHIGGTLETAEVPVSISLNFDPMVACKP